MKRSNWDSVPRLHVDVDANKDRDNHYVSAGRGRLTVVTALLLPNLTP